MTGQWEESSVRVSSQQQCVAGEVRHTPTRRACRKRSAATQSNRNKPCISVACNAPSARRAVHDVTNWLTMRTCARMTRDTGIQTGGNLSTLTQNGEHGRHRSPRMNHGRITPAPVLLANRPIDSLPDLPFGHFGASLNSASLNSALLNSVGSPTLH